MDSVDEYLNDESSYYFYKQQYLLNEIINYSKLVESKIIEVIDEYKKQHGKYAAELFETFHREAIIIQLISLLERRLVESCNILTAELSLNLKLNDISGNGIERSKTYLLKYAGLSFSFEQGKWDELKVFQKLRNILVHVGDLFDQSHPEFNTLNRYAKRTNFIIVRENYMSVTFFI